MNALVYGGPGQRAWQPAPRPVIREPGDAIVRITTSTICGTDLHILKGDVPTVTPGRILGHEGVGVGIQATFDICQSILAAGGRLANVGVHGKPVELHLEKRWPTS